MSWDVCIVDSQGNEVQLREKFMVHLAICGVEIRYEQKRLGRF